MAKVSMMGVPMAVMLVMTVVLFQESRFWELKQVYELFSCFYLFIIITDEDLNFVTGIAL